MPRLLLKRSVSKRYYRLQDQAPAAQTQGDARLIRAFSKKRKGCGYALMAEHSVFRILFFLQPKQLIPSWVGLLPEVQ
jgi:hypothetical protein